MTLSWSQNGPYSPYGGSAGDPLAPLLFSVGLHRVIEQLLCKHPRPSQGFFLGRWHPVEKRTFSDRVLICFALEWMELFIKYSKCEIYTVWPMGSFDGVLVVEDRVCWTHLGSPLCEQSQQPVHGAIARVEQTATAIANFAAQFPLQAVRLLRKKNACKNEDLFQHVPFWLTCSRLMHPSYSENRWLPLSGDVTSATTIGHTQASPPECADSRPRPHL